MVILVMLLLSFQVALTIFALWENVLLRRRAAERDSLDIGDENARRLVVARLRLRAVKRARDSFYSASDLAKELESANQLEKGGSA